MIKSHDLSGTGSFQAQAVAHSNMKPDSSFELHFLEDCGYCIDAPQCLPAGASLAFDSLGEVYSTGLVTTR